MHQGIYLYNKAMRVCFLRPLIDSGATFPSAKKIHDAAKRVTSQPIKWVINTGGQDHRWLGNGYFKAQDAELIAHTKAHTDMETRSSAQLQGLSILFSGDIVYVDRILGLIDVSRSKTWLQSFSIIDDLKPQIIVPGHGKVTNLATAQTQTRDLLVALREHVKKSIDGDGDMNLAVKSFNAKPFSHLKHAEVWILQLVNATYLEVERE